MQKCTSRSPCPIDDFLCQYLVVVAIIGLRIAYHVDQPSPAASNADDLVSLPRRANRHSSNCGVESRDITTTGQYANYTFFRSAHSCLHEDSLYCPQLYNFPRRMITLILQCTCRFCYSGLMWLAKC